MIVFVKILKKYDKIIGWNMLLIYMKEVESFYFVILLKVRKLRGVLIICIDVV